MIKPHESYTKFSKALRYFTIVFIYLIASSVAWAKAPAAPLFGIVVPLKVEGNYFMQTMTDKKEITVGGLHYTLGKIADKNVVLIFSGLGKINATIIATELVEHFHPTFIVLSGSSGIIDPNIKKGDVVVGKDVDNVDLGVLNSKGHTFSYPEDLYQPQIKKYLPLVFTLPADLTNFLMHLSQTGTRPFLLGKIATSDFLPNTPQQVKWMDHIGVDVVEMEGASLMQVCWLLQRPCVVVRGASNLTSEKITHADIAIAADHAAEVAIAIIKNIR